MLVVMPLLVFVMISSLLREVVKKNNGYFTVR